MRKWWKVIASAVLAGTVISASMSAAGAEDVAGAQNASGTESAAGAQNAAGAESVSGAQNAAGAENAAVIEQSIISIATLAEMDVEANQAAILALVQGIADQVEPGSDAAATTASIIALVQSGAGQKEAVLVLLDKLKGEIAGDASAPAETAETVVTQTEGTGTVTAESGVTVWKEYGTDAVLFSSGFVLDRVLAAADLLKEQGVNVTVADINILYGEDPTQILEVMAKSDQLFTVEDHNINGGLGSYISRLACEHKPAFVTRIALTTYGESGPAKELADDYGFSPEAIAQKVRDTLKK